MEEVVSDPVVDSEDDFDTRLGTEWEKYPGLYVLETDEYRDASYEKEAMKKNGSRAKCRW